MAKPTPDAAPVMRADFWDWKMAAIVSILWMEPEEEIREDRGTLICGYMCSILYPASSSTEIAELASLPLYRGR
jgi:hypothetical protein